MSMKYGVSSAMAFLVLGGCAHRPTTITVSRVLEDRLAVEIRGARPRWRPPADPGLRVTLVISGNLAHRALAYGRATVNEAVDNLGGHLRLEAPAAATTPIQWRTAHLSQDTRTIRDYLAIRLRFDPASRRASSIRVLTGKIPFLVGGKAETVKFSPLAYRGRFVRSETLRAGRLRVRVAQISGTHLALQVFGMAETVRKMRIVNAAGRSISRPGYGPDAGSGKHSYYCYLQRPIETGDRVKICFREHPRVLVKRFAFHNVPLP